jgi:hypothetical protein
VEAIGHECHEDVCLDTFLQLMVDRSKAEIILEIFERGFDLDQLNVELPQMRRVPALQGCCRKAMKGG